MSTFSIVLYSPGAEHFHEAVVFAAGARAQGKNVLLFLRGPALAAFVKNEWPEPAIDDVRVGLAAWGDAEAALADIRAKGKVQVYACSAWVRMLNLDAGMIASRVDAVIGLTGFLSQAEGGQIIYI